MVTKSKQKHMLEFRTAALVPELWSGNAQSAPFVGRFQKKEACKRNKKKGVLMINADGCGEGGGVHGCRNFKDVPKVLTLDTHVWFLSEGETKGAKKKRRRTQQGQSWQIFSWREGTWVREGRKRWGGEGGRGQTVNGLWIYAIDISTHQLLVIALARTLQTWLCCANNFTHARTFYLITPLLHSHFF